MSSQNPVYTLILCDKEDPRLSRGRFLCGNGEEITEYFFYCKFSPSFFPGIVPAHVYYDGVPDDAALERIRKWMSVLHPQIPLSGLPAGQSASDVEESGLSGDHSASCMRRSEDRRPLFSPAFSIRYLEELTDLNRTERLPTPNAPDLENFRFFCCLLHLSARAAASDESQRLLEDAALQVCRKIGGGIPCLQADGFLPLFFSRDRHSSEREEALQEAISEILSVFSGRIIVHYGTSHQGINGLHTSFYEAFETYYVDRLDRPCHSFVEISKPESKVSKAPRLVQLERAIRGDMEYHKGENTVRYVSQWFEEGKRQNYTLQNFKCDAILLYSSIKNIIFDMYVLSPKRIKIGTEAYEILNTESIEELQQWFQIWLTYTLGVFEPVHSRPSFQLNEVLEFINEHITEDLSLDRVSSYFFINPSYFSTLFRREAGQTFISYITAQKMEKARDLLQQNHRVAEVARMLGYDDTKHFRSLYKSHFGHPPSEDIKHCRV